jgi:hypothetical protein
LRLFVCALVSSAARPLDAPAKTAVKSASQINMAGKAAKSCGPVGLLDENVGFFVFLPKLVSPKR